MVGIATGWALARARAGARDPAHDGGARECRWRDCDRAGQPGAVGDRRRAAGPAPPRARAVSRGQAPRSCRRVSGVGRPAGARAGRSRRGRARLQRGAHRGGAGARDRADGRLGGRGRAGRPARRCDARRPLARGRQGLGRAARGVSRLGRERPRWSWAPARTSRRPGRRSSSWPSGSGVPSGRSRSAPAPAFPRITRSSQVISRPIACVFARRCPPTTPCSRWVRRCSGSTRTSRGRSSRSGTRVAMVSQYPAEVHRSAVELAVLADPGAVCAELARRRPGAEPPSRRCRSRARAACATGARRAAPRRSRARCARRPAPAKRDRDRGVSVEPTRADRAPARARVGRRAQPGDGRSRLRDPGRDRYAAGADRAPGRRDRRVTARRSTADPGALERRHLRRRRPARDPRERRVRDHGQARRAARRRASVAELRGRHRRPCDRVRLPCAADHRARASCSRCSTRSCPAWPRRTEPLLLEIAVAADATFAP